MTRLLKRNRVNLVIFKEAQAGIICRAERERTLILKTCLLK